MSDSDLMQLAGFEFGIHDMPKEEIDTELLEDDMVMPSIKPQKKINGKPIIVVIDDDYSTLDLMKIYLQRDYEYVAFDGPRDAIFYLNKNVPSLIFLDCYINMISAKRVVEIIHSYKELENVPIVYVTEPDEKGAIMAKGITGVSDFITRPIARGTLQEILDKYPDTRR